MGKTKLISLNDLSLEELEVDADLIPLMTTDDEEAISKEPIPEVIPILPLRNTVLFPGVVIPITATRDKSIQLIRDANTSNKLIGVVAQLDSTVQSQIKMIFTRSVPLLVFFEFYKCQMEIQRSFYKEKNVFRLKALLSQQHI